MVMNREKIDRRDFIVKSSAFAAAGLILPACADANLFPARAFLGATIKAGKGFKDFVADRVTLGA